MNQSTQQDDNQQGEKGGPNTSAPSDSAGGNLKLSAGGWTLNGWTQSDVYSEACCHPVSSPERLALRAVGDMLARLDDLEDCGFIGRTLQETVPAVCRCEDCRILGEYFG